MNKRKIVFLTFIIVIAAILALSTGCKQESGGEKNVPGNLDSGNKNTEAAEPEISPKDKIPVQDYGGKDFNFFICDEFWTHRDIIAEELTGEPINDAKYNRYKTIEDKYNININQIYRGGSPETFNELRKSIASNDVQYHLSFLHASSIAQVISAGYLMDILKLPYPDFTNPWWNKNLMASMTVKNVLLLCPSVISLPYSSAICFNKQMVQDYAMESPYETVKKGEWTMDKFYEICKNVSKDLNGDGVMDKDDQYGFTTQNFWMLKSYMYAGNQTVLVKDSNDIPQLNKNYDRLSQIVEKMVKILSDKNVTYMFDSVIDNDFPISMNTGRIFAIGVHLSEVAYLRYSDIDYGIVPLPKLDKAQENYTGISWDGFYGVPVNSPDTEMSGLIFEALTAESYYSILPIFKNQMLSVKFTRDEESVKMLDMIYDNIIYDMGPNYGTLDPYTNIIAELYAKKNANVMSYMERSEVKLEHELEKIIANYSEYID